MKHSITNSERSTAACPQRWLLQYGLALRPEARVYALDVGTFTHDALETLFNAFATGSLFPLSEALETIERKRAAEVDRITNASGSPSGMFDPSTYVDPLDVDRVNEAAEVASKLIVGYHTHWNNDPFTVIRNEGNVDTPVYNPAGNPSPRTRYTGKVDKVVEYQGRTLIMEHKTTTLDLGEWYEKHRRSPQARGYAFALRREGIEAEGIIYDLIQSKPPRRSDELAVLKDGSRLAKPSGLPWTTADEFATAVVAVHQPNVDPDSEPVTKVIASVEQYKRPDAVDWYVDTYRALEARDRSGFWYRREVELFDVGEVDRTSREIYHDATRIRRWKEETEPYRDSIINASSGYVPMLVEDALHDIGDRFPRQSSLCWQWNRLCSFASLCSSHSAHDVQGFRVERSPGGHSELSSSDETSHDDD